MRTLNISLPEPMKAFVETQVAEGLYGSASDYIRALIREDLKRKSKADLERKLLQAIESGDYQALTPELFAQLRARVTDKAAENDTEAL